MFKKVLIANRGEIAVRIIRACRELGIRTVAVFSTADRSSLHAQIADEAVCIGPADSLKSYLNIEAIISACEITGADAIHPGFGFLSESAKFARVCRKCGIKFIGPSPESIEMLGNKAEARKNMARVGVPVIPGSDGPVLSVEDAVSCAESIGYPVLIKASAGGGGRGIRMVNSSDEISEQYTAAKQEAYNFFGDDSVYIEKFIDSPRHIEMQIASDYYGNRIYLGERDCSIQRRHQKLIEESPSPVMTEKFRKKMGEASLKAAEVSNYQNIGTVEFLVDKNNNFYFMEMNTRIQVEHPITEFVTGVDLVKTQISIAAGEELGIEQDDIRLRGHAIECRINAESPDKKFRPCPGVISALHTPGGPGIRVDSAAYQGYTVTPYYDSMIAKLIVYGNTRDEAVAKMKWALSEFIVGGIDTNIDFQLSLIKSEKFESGDYNNSFVDDLLNDK